MALKIDPQPLGIHSMVDITPLCGLFQVHLKLSYRAVTLIEQSCMTSYHNVLQQKKTKIINLKKE